MNLDLEDRELIKRSISTITGLKKSEIRQVYLDNNPMRIVIVLLGEVSSNEHFMSMLNLQAIKKSVPDPNIATFSLSLYKFATLKFLQRLEERQASIVQRIKDKIEMDSLRYGKFE